MKKIIVSVIVVFMGLFFGMTCSYAYEVGFNGGFSPSPAYVSGTYLLSDDSKAAIHNACVQWNGAGGGDIVYRSTTDHSNTVYPCSNNKNEITKLTEGPNLPLMGAYRTVSTPFPFFYSYIVEYDININMSFQWSNQGESYYYDVGNSMTHELGHCMGLAHSSNTDASMYISSILGETKKRSIENDDKSGVQAIY